MQNELVQLVLGSVFVYHFAKLFAQLVFEFLQFYLDCIYVLLEKQRFIMQFVVNLPRRVPLMDLLDLWQGIRQDRF